MNEMVMLESSRSLLERDILFQIDANVVVFAAGVGQTIPLFQTQFFVQRNFTLILVFYEQECKTYRIGSNTTVLSFKQFHTEN